MADTKISQLPAATTPLSGAEVVPLVQSGATVQTPVNSISLLTAATANTFTASNTFTAANTFTASNTFTAANTFTANQTINGGNPGLQLNSNTDFTPQVQATHAGATANSAPYYILKRARGTYSSPSIVSSGDAIGTILFQAHDGSDYRGAAAIVGSVDTTPGASDMPGRLSFQTTPDGSTATTERMRIDSSGNVIVTGAGGLGYGTGSGGTVTQITSKTTGVTLNKTNGQIVTSNALMAGGAEITFTVTNSTVAATDTIILHRASGGGAGSVGYTVYVDSTAAGSFVVYIKNLSGTNKSEAITLNFAVIKAVTS